MKCGRAWEVEAVADGRLRGEEKSSLVRHAAGCADCQAEQRSLAEVHAKMRALPVPDGTELEMQRLRARVLRAANAELLRAPPLSFARIAGTSVLVIVLSSVIGLGGLRLARPHHAADNVATADPASAERRARPDPTVEPMPDLAPSSTATTAPPLRSTPTAASLFESGVDTFNRGDFAAADAKLERFLRTFPADSRCEDASYLRAVASWRSERKTELARRYLAMYPEGFRRIEAKRIVDGTAE